MISHNPNMTTRILPVGREKTQLVVIDDYLQNIDILRQHALEHGRFELEKQSYYPGIRAAMVNDDVRCLVHHLSPLFYRFYAIPKDLKAKIKLARFSQISLQEDELNEGQVMPHYDSTFPYYFAVMLYINQGDFGGTSFYRHRPTGYENIVSDTKQHYLQEVTKYLQTNPKDFIQQYFVGSDGQYEFLATVPYKSNRLLIYPGTLLHSASINAQNDIESNVTKGRLTANLFIEFS